MNDSELTTVFLHQAEETLRDISERVEHAGTIDQMIKDISVIIDRYWKDKNIKRNESYDNI